MKTLLFTIIFILFPIISISKEITEFNLQPLVVQYTGIVSNDELIIAYGDYGCVNISYDSAKTWNQKFIFKNSYIIDLVVNDTNLLAFNFDGKIKKSIDKGNNWEQILDINGKIYSVVKSADGYLIRSDFYLILINDKGKILKKKELNSKIYFDYIEAKRLTISQLDIKQILNLYRNSIKLFNGLYYIYVDSLNFQRYDANLVFIDKYNVNTTKISSFLTDDNYIYFYSNNRFVKTKNLIEFIEININSFLLAFFYSYLYKNTLYHYDGYGQNNTKLFQKLNENDSLEVVDSILYKTNYITDLINNSGLDYLTIFNNKVYNASNRKDKTIISFDFNKKNIQEFKIESNISNSQFYNIIKISEKDFVLQNVYRNDRNDIANNYFKTNDNFQTYLPTMKNNGVNNNKLCNIFWSNNKKLEAIHGYYDNKLNTYIFYENINQKDTFQNFRQHIYINSELVVMSNLYRNKNKELYFSSSNLFNDTVFTRVNIVDSNFKAKTFHLFKNKKIYYINNNPNLIENPNLIIEKDYRDSSKYISKSNSDFTKIVRLHNISNTEEVLNDFYNFKANDDEKLVFCNYYYNKNIADIVIYDFKTESLKTIKSFKYSDFNLITSKVHFTFDQDTLFVAIKDSIFYLDYLNQTDSLNSYLQLPNKGEMFYKFQKYNDIIFANYQDSLTENNTYKIKFYKKEVEDPKPIIQADDYDFGDYDIKSTNFITQTIKLKNTSNEADLIISEVNYIESIDYETNILESLQPLPYKISKGEEVEYTITFKPKSIGNKTFEIEYVSDATENDNIAKITGKAIDTLISSIEYNIEENKIIYNSPVYPNPTNGDISVEIAYLPDFNINDANYEIYNVLGTKININKDIRLTPLDNFFTKITWSSSGLDIGIYFLNISDGKSTINIKFIVN